MRRQNTPSKHIDVWQKYQRSDTPSLLILHIKDQFTQLVLSFTGVCNWRYGATYSSSLTVEASRHVFPAPLLSPGCAQRLGWLQLRQNPDRCSYNYNTGTCEDRYDYFHAHVLGPRSSRILYITSPRRWRRTMAPHNGTYVRVVCMFPGC